MCGGRRDICVGILGCGIVWSPTQELGAIRLMLGLFACLLHGVYFRAALGQLLTEALDPLEGFFLLFGHNLLAREDVVFFEGLGEGGERCGDVADVGWGGLVFRGEGGEVGAERLALAQGGVVGNVLEKVSFEFGVKGGLYVPW